MYERIHTIADRKTDSKVAKRKNEIAIYRQLYVKQMNEKESE